MQVIQVGEMESILFRLQQKWSLSGNPYEEASVALLMKGAIEVLDELMLHGIVFMKEQSK
jgi:hypothetical protein